MSWSWVRDICSWNIQETLKQHKYLRTNLKYSNILDVYEQTKKLDTEELARMILQGYIDWG